MCFVNNQKVWRTLDVTEVEAECLGKFKNRGGCCLGKTGCWNKQLLSIGFIGETASRSTVNKGFECGGVRQWLMAEKHSWNPATEAPVNNGCNYNGPKASQKVMEACKGFLKSDEDYPLSAKGEGSLTAKPTY
ncbi:unnamed protein product [Lactuca saligna]|uniref:Uncharacterized protein n=1 Tax=Lactuca saligna TaxID=75948 RepID=A0AA36EJ30_LACSI|nr:unnamed protein product [Lactuca saligna]